MASQTIKRLWRSKWESNSCLKLSPFIHTPLERTTEQFGVLSTQPGASADVFITPWVHMCACSCKWWLLLNPLGFSHPKAAPFSVFQRPWFWPIWTILIPISLFYMKIIGVIAVIWLHFLSRLLWWMKPHLECLFKDQPLYMNALDVNKQIAKNT